MLRLVTNGKFLQFGDKILEHMRMFSDPEKLLSMQLLEAGTEEWVASGLLGLLHLLPWLPSESSSSSSSSSSSGGGSSGSSSSTSSAIVSTSDPSNPTSAPIPAPAPVPLPLLQDPSSPKYVLRSFLNSYALTTIELTATWTKFRPSSLSPFIPPFAKFLTRYPVESVKYFFSAERILDLEVI